MAVASVVRYWIFVPFFFIEVCWFLVKAQTAVCHLKISIAVVVVSQQCLSYQAKISIQKAHGECCSLYREGTGGGSGTHIWPLSVQWIRNSPDLTAKVVKIQHICLYGLLGFTVLSQSWPVFVGWRLKRLPRLSLLLCIIHAQAFVSKKRFWRRQSFISQSQTCMCTRCLWKSLTVFESD